MILHKLNRFQDVGLLILRIGIGIAFMVHGAPKLLGGPERWASLGGAMGNLGITFAPTFWGFMAGVAEFGGGLLLVLGFLFRPALFLLLFTMIVAATQHIVTGQGSPWHAIEAGVLFLSLIFIGPGRYSLDERAYQRKRSLY
jgi:putative oxidoreductase